MAGLYTLFWLFRNLQWILLHFESETGVKYKLFSNFFYFFFKNQYQVASRFLVL